MTSTREYVIIWVCDECMFTHANGEGDPERPADLPDAWAQMPYAEYGHRLAMGMISEEHDRSCSGEDDECGCELRDFDTWGCDGCGDRLAGRRHAFTVFDA
jgi:ribosomal protein L37AE/L43A